MCPKKTKTRTKKEKNRSKQKIDVYDQEIQKNNDFIANEFMNTFEFGQYVNSFLFQNLGENILRLLIRCFRCSNHLK